MKKIFMLFILSGCSNLAQLEEYQIFQIEAFEHECQFMPNNIYFNSLLENDIAGYCLPTVGIFLNPRNWARYKKYQRLELIFHEIGHCGLGYQHGPDDGIMSSTMHSETEIEASWDTWVEDFFKDCKKF